MSQSPRPPFIVPFTLLVVLACGGAPNTATLSGANQESSQDALQNDTAEAGDLIDSGLPASCAARANDASNANARSAPECGPPLPTRAFSSALCSCEDTSVAGFLRTRSFQSSAGEQTPERLGGTVGVNRSYITGGLADVGGSFAVAGTRDVLFGGVLQVGEDLRFNPAFDVAGIVQVGRDAAFASSLRAAGVIDIGRDLYRDPGTRFLGLALLSVGGEQFSEEVSVAPPCACDAGEIVDVPALVAEARTNNDNAAIELDSNEIDLVVGIGRVLALPTGRYHLHQIAGAGALDLHIEGRVSLFVDDDFYAGGLFRVSLAPDAEFDLFVEDDFALAGAAVIGDPTRPAATRIYVGGTGDIAIAGLNLFAGNVYAPRANVLVGGVGRVLGSLFGKNIIAAGFLDVGYDESVREGNPVCPPPGGDGDTPSDGPAPCDPVDSPIIR